MRIKPPVFVANYPLEIMMLFKVMVIGLGIPRPCVIGLGPTAVPNCTALCVIATKLQHRDVPPYLPTPGTVQTRAPKHQSINGDNSWLT